MVYDLQNNLDLGNQICSICYSKPNCKPAQGQHCFVLQSLTSFSVESNFSPLLLRGGKPDLFLISINYQISFPLCHKQGEEKLEQRSLNPGYRPKSNRLAFLGFQLVGPPRRSFAITHCDQKGQWNTRKIGRRLEDILPQIRRPSLFKPLSSA